MKSALVALVEKFAAIARHAATRQAGGEWLAAFLLVILVVPAGPNHVLIPLLALTAAIGVFGVLAASRRQLRVSSAILLFAVAGAVLAVHGFARSNDGWVDVAIPLVGGPITWFFITQLGNDWFAKRVVDIAALATIAISLMVFALNFKVGDGLVRWIEPSAFGFRDLGRSRTSFVGLTTLIATVPMVLSSVLDRTIAKVATPRFALHVAAVVLCVPAVLLSGRQALIGAIAVFPVLVLVRHVMGFNFRGMDLPEPHRPSPRVLVAAICLAVAGAVGAMAMLEISPNNVVDDVLASVGIGDTASQRVVYSAEVRTLQSDSLLEGFLARPILGHGAGAVSPEYDTWRGYATGDDFVFSAGFEPRPWRAELSYQLLLFEGGITGAALYAAAAVWASLKVLGEYRRHGPAFQSVMRATVIGALSILVGAAFNPHLRAVGAQVLLFLPVIVAASAATSATNPRRTTSP